jgi:GNAT superfamily N-acetyltransferase
MPALQEIRISHLSAVPEMHSRLERWFIQEWSPWYGPDGQGDAKSDLAACRDPNALPICLIALDRDNTLLGTASLKPDSVGSELNVGPWLAAVLVDKAHQGKGIGTALVKAIEEQAVRMGIGSIYTSTDTAMGILERCGWQVFGTTMSLRGGLTVFRRQFGGEADSAQ